MVIHRITVITIRFFTILTILMDTTDLIHLIIIPTGRVIMMVIMVVTILGIHIITEDLFLQEMCTMEPEVQDHQIHTVLMGRGLPILVREL